MDSQKSGQQTIVTEDVEIVGTIKASSSLQIDGKLNGDLNCTSNVVVGASANVKGNLSVNSATVHGHVNGNIVAKDLIELKTSARINGDVKAKRLMVEDGVSFVGKAEVNPSGIGAGRTASAESSTSVDDILSEVESEGAKVGKGGSFLENKK